MSEPLDDTPSLPITLAPPKPIAVPIKWPVKRMFVEIEIKRKDGDTLTYRFARIDQNELIKQIVLALTNTNVASLEVKVSRADQVPGLTL